MAKISEAARDRGTGAVTAGWPRLAQQTSPPQSLARLSRNQKRGLAKLFGYESIELLMAASQVAVLDDGSYWNLTRDGHGGWTAWNVCCLDLLRRKPSDEEPIAVARTRGQQAPSADSGRS